MSPWAAGLIVGLTAASAWHGAGLKHALDMSSACMDEKRGVFEAMGRIFLCRQYKPESVEAERRQVERLEAGSP